MGPARRHARSGRRIGVAATRSHRARNVRLQGRRAFGGTSPVSPDGKQVLFRSQRSGWLNYSIVPVDGGTPRALTAESAEQSDGSWSPDGKSIAYVANHNGTKGLYVVASTGGAPRGLVVPTEGVVSRVSGRPMGRGSAICSGRRLRPTTCMWSTCVRRTPRG